MHVAILGPDATKGGLFGDDVLKSVNLALHEGKSHFESARQAWAALPMMRALTLDLARD